MNIFQTDSLSAFLANLYKNQAFQLVMLIGACIVIYWVISKYVISARKQNNFSDILVGTVYGMGGKCNGDIPKMDEVLIRDPKYLTSSMVIPEPTVKEEARRKTRMEILNMFYNSFDDDVVSYNNRPKGLYVIP
jgi:hypothetical protein